MSSMTVAGTLLRKRGLVNALVEPHTAAVILHRRRLCRPPASATVFHALHVDGDIFADVGQCGGRLDGVSLATITR